MAKTKFDFSGYATKNGIKCADGRIILKNSFAHQHGKTVPLVWQHLHNEPSNILGHAVLENRDDGVYCYGKFNDTEAGQNAKQLVEHGDISALSIFANQLKEKMKNVSHGTIREVSLVLAGANEGAFIENIGFAHSDEIDETEAIICMGIELANDDENNDALQHAENDRTVAEVFDTLNEEQKNVVYAMIAHALAAGEEEEVEHGDGIEVINEAFNTLDEDQQTAVATMIAHAFEESGKENDLTHYFNKGDQEIMKHNVFDKNTKPDTEKTLTHDQMTAIITDVKKHGGSLKDSFLAHAAEYGFDPIEVLFPDARLIDPSAGPNTIARDKTWVDGVLSDTTHTPFSRIKSITADLTVEEARAKGYVTGSRKREEVIPLLKRVTTPTTIYKKQKLDRDDISDITDFDVVMWLKREMRVMLNEEIARAILIGDGRDVSDPDKINEGNIRPIVSDDESVYIHRKVVPSDRKIDDIIDDIIRVRKYYRGSGNPKFYTSTDLVTEMLLVKDTNGRRIYSSITELASVLRVSSIVEVEILNSATRKISDTETNDILGLIVNLKDYAVGADKGGQVNMFDDFDIDYNQEKYLIETRISGALTKPKSALVIERKSAPAVG